MSYPLQDGSARKQPFPIDVQLGSIREKHMAEFLFGFLCKNKFIVDFQCFCRVKYERKW